MCRKQLKDMEIGEEGYIRATVGYSFLVTHNIIHTTLKK